MMMGIAALPPGIQIRLLQCRRQGSGGVSGSPLSLPLDFQLPAVTLL